MNKKEIKVGGLSRPSKMPGKAYSIPATRCITGSKLAQVEGSVCHNCYALRGRYNFKNVQEALERRFNTLENDSWVEDMIEAIGNEKWFRWHDSGDIQSVNHLRNICLVAEGTKNTKHWLPTRETKMVIDYGKKYGAFPDNLIVRVSSTMVGDKPITSHIHTSTVHYKGNEVYGHECPAPTQGNKCQDCRACWDKRVRNVSYQYH